MASYGGSGGGKGGGGGSAGSDYIDEEGEAGSAVGATSLDGDRDPAAWDGFFKKYGDSKVGVASSDLFRMVELRVSSERKVMGH